MEPEYLCHQGWAWISKTAYRRGLCKICTIKILVTKYAIEILELYKIRVSEIIHRMEIYHLMEPILILDLSWAWSISHPWSSTNRKGRRELD